MNSKQSMWKLLCGVAGVAGMGLLITNCTIKTSSDDGSGGTGNSSNSSAGAGNTTSGACSPVGSVLNGCICAGNLTSHQVCESNGTYGACVCAASSEGGASSGGASNGGATSYAGNSTSNAGAAPADGGEGGAVDNGMDCYSCLITNCAAEWAACNTSTEKNPDTDSGGYCISSGAPKVAPGQIENIIACINTERLNGLVKRDIVRACGSSLGASASPTNFVWAPPKMTPETEALMNCMADAPDEVNNPGAWATDTAVNYPATGPRPWDANTCAKDSCTSALAP